MEKKKKIRGKFYKFKSFSKPKIKSIYDSNGNFVSTERIKGVILDSKNRRTNFTLEDFDNRKFFICSEYFSNREIISIENFCDYILIQDSWPFEKNILLYRNHDKYLTDSLKSIGNWSNFDACITEADIENFITVYKNINPEMADAIELEMKLKEELE